MNTLMSILRTCCLAAVVASQAVLMAQTDTFGYKATDLTAYSYFDVAATGATMLRGSDDAVATLSLPFTFRFYGVNYSSVCVSSNGLLSFGSCIPNDFTNLDLTSQSPTGNQPLIAPFWMDLTFSDASTGSVVYETLGTAGARRFIVQWNNATALNVPGTLQFQVILLEGSNDLLFQYRNVDVASAQVSKGASATVGIRGGGGESNGQRIQWSYKMPVITSGSAIRFSAPVSAVPIEVTSRFKITTSAFVLNRQIKSANSDLYRHIDANEHVQCARGPSACGRSHWSSGKRVGLLV